MEASPPQAAYRVLAVFLGREADLAGRIVHVLDQNVHGVQTVEHIRIARRRRGGRRRRRGQRQEQERHEGVHGTGTGLGERANTRVTRTLVLFTNTAPWRVTSGKKSSGKFK